MKPLTKYLALAAAATMPVSGWTYSKDVHFDLTYAMCRINNYSSAEALQVASGDQGMDDNDTVVASLDVPQNYAYHSLANSQGEATQRLNQLWQRAVQTRDLVKLGQYLHYAQDYFSHRDYSKADPLSPGWVPFGPKLGHGMYGHTPDCVPHNVALAEAMAQFSMTKIRQFEELVLNRKAWTRDVSCVNPLIPVLAKLYTASKGVTGSTSWTFPTADATVSTPLENAIQGLIRAKALDAATQDAAKPYAVPYTSRIPYQFDLMAEYPTPQRPMHTYNLEIQTGRWAGAGTDANIYVRLVGSKGSTIEYSLNHYISGNAFEAGHVDHVTLTQLIRRTVNQSEVSMAVPLIHGGPYTTEFSGIVDIGDVQQVIVRSDNSGLGSDWFLDGLKVNGVPFACNNWFTKQTPVRTLTPMQHH